MTPALLIGLSTLRVAAAAATPPATYLLPERFVTEPGASLVVHLRQGTAAGAGHPMPWLPDQVRWFFVRTTGTQANVPADEVVCVGEGAISVAFAEPDAAIVGLDLAVEITQLDEAGRATVGGAALPLPAGPLPILHQRSARTIVRVAAPGAAWVASGAAVSKTGQQAEIRPLADPTLIRVGSDLPLRVFIEGDKRAGVRVTARGPDAVVRACVSDAVGAAHFRIDALGPWNISFQHLEPSAETSRYSGVLYSGTLTFEVRAEAGR